MDDNDKPTTFSIIVSIIIVIIVVFGYLYIMNWSEYNSFKARNDRCKICAENQNLICSTDNSIPSIYEYVNDLHTSYTNCMNDQNISKCEMCYPDLPV